MEWVSGINFEAPTLANFAAHFTAASSQYADAPVSSGYIINPGNAFSMCAWVKPDSASGNNRIFGRWSGTISGHDTWLLQINSAGTQFEGWTVSGVGTFVNVVATEGINVGGWSFVYFEYDQSANGQGISINNGTMHTTNQNTNLQDAGTIGEAFGSDSVDGAGHFFDGAITAVGFWKRKLTSGERTSLYNGGHRLMFSQLPGSLLTNLISWHDFTNNFNDGSGNGNNFTAHNSPTFVAGP